MGSKLFSKIGIALAGIAMAVGVGVGLGQKEFKEAEADNASYTHKIGWGGASGEVGTYTNFNGITGTLTNVLSFSAAKDGNVGTTPAISSNQLRLYYGSDGKGGILTLTPVSGVTITSAVITSTTSPNVKYKVNGGSATSVTPNNNVYTISNISATSSLEIQNVHTTNTALRIANIVITYTAPATVSPESISCSSQTISVMGNVDLKAQTTFSPNGASCSLSYAIQSGSDCIDLNTQTGVVTGKKGGAAVVTITPSDTSSGAHAINVSITINSIASHGLTIGEKYVIYAIDTNNSYNAELTGVTSNLGTVASFNGVTPACSYLLTAEDGYYENTVAFKNGTKYLSLNTDSNNLHNDKTSIDANASWIVSWTNDVPTIYNAVYSNRAIRFNYNLQQGGPNPRFACYNNSMPAANLYHYIEPVSSLVIDTPNNAMSIGSSDDTEHTVTVTINASAGDKKINIAHQSGTNNLFTKSTAQITANSSGVGTFTITGTGATTGTETFRISSNSTPSKYVDLVVTALNDSATYFDISMNVAGYSLDGVTHVLEGEDASITLLASPKYNLPSSIVASGAGTEGEDWSYDDETGDIVVLGVSNNITISFETNPADFILSLSGAKTDFKEGDSFSSEGLIVTAIYDDESFTEEVIESGYTIDSSEFDGAHHGTYTIMVSYSGKSTTYDVTVVAVVSFTYSGIDSLTRSLIGVTGKNYEDWSDISVSDGSSAVYAGNSAGTYENGNLTVESIQIRGSNNSGIITTTSGGLATKVTISWNSQTANGRILNIYGKNTSYSATSELYSADAAVQGTLIGTIVYGTSTELTINSSYSFIGIRPSSGSAYLNGVDISWSQTEATDADIAVVNNFITTKMQPQIAHNPDPNLDVNNEGQCDSEHWYDDAKTAFNALKTRQKEIILTSSSYALTNSGNDWTYAQVKARLLAWAAANHESLNDNTKTLGVAVTGGVVGVINDSANNTLIAIIIIASVSALAVGGYFFIRRKHQ